MTLALLPIATLLLLLSGAGTPAFAAGQDHGAAALMRGLFGSGGAARDRSSSSPRPGVSVLRYQRALHPLAATALAGPALVTFRGRREAASREETLAAAAPGAFDRKQYRTRFGFADGAYRAIGPPSHGPRTDLGWSQS